MTHVEGMRAVAALVVYLNHAFGQAFLNSSAAAPSGLLSLAGYSMVAGHLAVTVFIVISGFCLTLPVAASNDQLRGGLWAFFKRRARRILPAYYGSLALALALIWTVIGDPTGTLWDVAIRVRVEHQSILSHLLLMQDLYGTSHINYVLWSIAVEWHIYFLFPIFVWAWRRFGPISTISTAMLCGYTIHLAFHTTRIGRANSHFIGMFTLGMLAAYTVASQERRYATLCWRCPWAALGIAAAAVTAILMWRWGIDLSVARFAWLDLPVGIFATSVLILSSRSESSLVSRLCSWKPLVAVGTFSYSLYLLHAPLLQVLWQYVLRPAGLSDTEDFAFLMTVGLGCVLLAAYGFYKVFEEPFMGRARASSNHRTILTAAHASVA